MEMYVYFILSNYRLGAGPVIHSIDFDPFGHPSWMIETREKTKQEIKRHNNRCCGGASDLSSAHLVGYLRLPGTIKRKMKK